MSKIERYQGNLRAFASNAQGLERTVFGETAQADDLTSQVTQSFLRGWGIVGASEHPSLEDFNAAMYAMSQFIAYQHQVGVPEWHPEQEYYIGSICTHNGESYQSLENANVGDEPPSAKWTPVLTSRNGLSNLGLGEGSALPVGVPVPWPSATTPTGWLKCNGAAFTAAQYPKLAQAYPSLKLPDLRGEFIRGWDDGRGVDSGRELMSAQNHALQQHTHTVVVPLRTTDSDRGSNDSLYSVDNTQTLTSSGASGNTATETRPRNVAFNFIVRAA